MDGAPFMSGSLKEFITLAKQKNSGIVFTHCFLNREALISKSVVPELQKVLDKMTNMVNCIKSGPLQSRLLSALCSVLEAAHTQLLLHMEMSRYHEGGCFQGSVH
jgi:hypothetical protein